MAKFVMTYSSHPQTSAGRSEAAKDAKKAAKILTDKGEGSSSFVKVENRAGDCQVNIYKR